MQQKFHWFHGEREREQSLVTTICGAFPFTPTDSLMPAGYATAHFSSVQLLSRVRLFVTP